MCARLSLAGITKELVIHKYIFWKQKKKLSLSVVASLRKVFLRPQLHRSTDCTATSNNYTHQHQLLCEWLLEADRWNGVTKEGPCSKNLPEVTVLSVEDTNLSANIQITQQAVMKTFNFHYRMEMSHVAFRGLCFHLETALPKVISPRMYIFP